MESSIQEFNHHVCEYKSIRAMVVQGVSKNDPLCCFAKISITNGTFLPNFTHTSTQQIYTC